LAEETTQGSTSSDSRLGTVLVAFVLCLVASAAVSGVAIALHDRQVQNRENDRKKVILEVAGLYRADTAINELFAQVEPRVVDLETGEYVDAPGFDQRKAANDPAQSVSIPPAHDFAKIRRRAKRASVYLVRENGEVKHMILPVHGYGLWSTMYGYVALEPDGNTIYGVQFYEQAETAGLGDKVADPAWVGQFKGKRVYGDDGRVRLRAVKGGVAENSPTAGYEVDGMSGATLTSDGVSNMMLYWFGDQGFGAYLKKRAS
jgi:Na+-transporting NADH:ubiquinone oxidoreductase subunit C